MPFTWNGGGTTNFYVTADDVLKYMKIYDTYTSTTNYNADVELLNTIIIPQVCSYIDVITGRSWGKVLSSTERYSIGKPAYLGWYLVGAPVYLQHFPIIPASSTHTLVELGIWNGTQYANWIGTMVEARWGSYWVDVENGILWIIGWYWYMGYEVNATPSTPRIPSVVPVPLPNSSSNPNAAAKTADGNIAGILLVINNHLPS